MSADGIVWRAVNEAVHSLRANEKDVIVSVDDHGSHESQREFILVFDNRYQVKLQAWLGIGQTFIVIIVLGIGSLTLTKIITDLVLTPIEAMMDKVKRISENPLKAQQEEENE